MSHIVRTSFQTALASIATAAILAAQDAGPAFLRQIVVRTNDVVPGPSGLRFDRFGPISALGGDARAAIDDDGRIAFHAYLGDGNPSTLSPFDGIFKTDSKLGVSLVSLQRDTAPGTGGTVFIGFESLLVPTTPSIHAGRVTFRANIGASAPLIGIWSERFGSLGAVLLPFDRLPDTPAGSSVFEFSNAQRGNSIVMNVRYALAGGGPVGTDTEGLWVDSSGTLQTIAAKGVPAPGTEPGVVFDAGTNQALFGPIGTWDANRSGTVVFTGYLGGSAINVFNDEGIWVGSPGHLTLLVRESQRVPGLPSSVFLAPFGIQTFGPGETMPPTLNDRGTVLFGAVVLGPSFDISVPVFVRRDGQVRLLARASSILSATTSGDPAAGYPAPFTYEQFLVGSVNNANDIVLLGTATDGTFLGSKRAIWRDRGNGLELVAGVGRPVTAIPGLTFSSVDLAGFSDLGLLYYTGTMTGPGTDPRNDDALFAMDTRGRHVVVLRKGDVLDLSGNGGDVRIISRILPGSGVSDAGAKAVTVAFTDGSLAILRVAPVLPLVVNTRFLSAATGGTVAFQLDAALSMAGRPYILAGSASGIHPGLDLGGGVIVPLNPDAFLLFTLSGAPQLTGFAGMLDPNGRAQASLSTFGPIGSPD